MKRLLLLIVIMFFLKGLVAEELAVPALKGRVNDYAALLHLDEVSKLEGVLRTEEANTTNQIAILIIKTVGDDDPFMFSQRVFDQWKLGQVGKDNGILLVVFSDNIAAGKQWAQLRTGRGLEGALPDVKVKEILVRTIKPLMQSGHYLNGLMAGVQAIQMEIHKDFPVQQQKTASPETSQDGSAVVVLGVVFASIATICLFAFGVFAGIMGGIVGVLIGCIVASANDFSSEAFLATLLLSFSSGVALGLFLKWLFSEDSSRESRYDTKNYRRSSDTGRHRGRSGGRRKSCDDSDGSWPWLGGGNGDTGSPSTGGGGWFSSSSGSDGSNNSSSSSGFDGGGGGCDGGGGGD